jgi:arginyl-tRNA synthetase
VLHKILEQRLQQAVALVLPGANIQSVLVRPCPDPKFGDYQTNALMALAKERKMNPRQLATDVVAKLDVADLCEKPDIAGAGFINFRLKTTALATALRQALSGGPLFFQKAATPRTVIIDFSSPNVAKPMHVGHIRSTILGDSLARVLRLLGHRVITDNHIGDWGTQFGMLIFGWKIERFFENDPARLPDPIAELERVYKMVNKSCEGDTASLALVRQKFSYEDGLNLAEITPEQVLSKARSELVKLQGGDPVNRDIWNRLQAISKEQFDRVYNRLGIHFDYVLGESYYNPWLADVVRELKERGLATESEGAMVVLSDGKLPPQQDPFLIQKDGKWMPNPALVQKSDGASNYATTDLATLQFRCKGGQWGGAPDEIIYVTDARQQLHFRQVFAAFKRWHPEIKARLAHVWFGSILGEDGKPLKTRSGETVKLEALLDEAEEIAFKVVTEKNPDLPENERREIARVVGLGAIKYADLSQNRQSDYLFSWEKMLSFQGNTAPYLQYAYTRVRSIFRKGGVENATALADSLALEAPDEIALARHLLNFGLVLEAVADDYRPNFLCAYLHELSGQFARFYESCPVLKAEGAQKATRLALCDLTARVIRQGLEVLGIETTEQM